MGSEDMLEIMRVDIGGRERSCSFLLIRGESRMEGVCGLSILENADRGLRVLMSRGMRVKGAVSREEARERIGWKG